MLLLLFHNFALPEFLRKNVDISAPSISQYLICFTIRLQQLQKILKAQKFAQVLSKNNYFHGVNLKRQLSRSSKDPFADHIQIS